MLQPLDFIVRVRHKGLVERRQHRRPLHDHIRLLRVRSQTFQLHERLLGIEPSPRVVVMQPFAGTEGLAAVVLDAGAQVLFGLGEIGPISGMAENKGKNVATHCWKVSQGAILIW